MRLGIDISPLVYRTGVARYTANLVRALASLPELKTSLVLFGSSFRQKSALTAFANTIVPPPALSLHRLPPVVTSFLFNTLHFNVTRFTGPLDVFHAWDWYLPSVRPGHLVTTVHDLSVFKFPRSVSPQVKKHHTQTLKYLQKNRASVIAVSQTTKHDLIDLMGLDPLRITVIPEALPNEHALLVSPAQVALVKQKFSLTKPYFLMVGTREKRKNYPLQIEAWQHYKKDFGLVIVGQPGNEPLSDTEGVTFCDSVDELTLACLYRGSRLLLYASLYEGFGLPVLEAFFHGIPVVTSSLSSLPEVAGQAAVLVDPRSKDSIVLGIGKALQNSQALTALGRDRLRLFSWASVAQMTLAVYQKGIMS